MTTLVIEGHTRMQLCVSSYTLDMQVEKEYHILRMVSPYIGPQDRFNGARFLHLEPKDARPAFKLRPHKINNKPQGFPGAPVHQVFAVLFQNNPTIKQFSSQLQKHRTPNRKETIKQHENTITFFFNTVPLAFQSTAKETITTSRTDRINSKHDFK